jgi:sugar lactone lactonase YvrE
MQEHKRNVRTLAAKLDFPESPRWRNGELWFTDGPTIKIIGRDGNIRTHTKVDCQLLIGLSFTPEGDTLVSDATGRRILKINSKGDASVYADLSKETPYMINECMMMADGSVVVDDLGFDIFKQEECKPVQMILISPSGKVSRTASPMLFANGLVSVDGGNGLLVGEAFGGRIWQYRLVPGGGLDDGVVVNPSCDGIDGLARAPDGSIWYADVHRSDVVNVDGRKERRRIHFGLRFVTSCVLNDEASTLYITGSDSLVPPDLKFLGDGAIMAIDL